MNYKIFAFSSPIKDFDCEFAQLLDKILLLADNEDELLLDDIQELLEKLACFLYLPAYKHESLSDENKTKVIDVLKHPKLLLSENLSGLIASCSTIFEQQIDFLDCDDRNDDLRVNGPSGMHVYPPSRNRSFNDFDDDGSSPLIPFVLGQPVQSTLDNSEGSFSSEVGGGGLIGPRPGSSVAAQLDVSSQSLNGFSNDEED